MADEVEQVLQTGTRVALKIVVTATRLTSHLVMAAVRSFLRQRQESRQQGEQSLKRLNAHGKQLDHVDVSRSDLREVRAQMKKYAVDFSVLREPGTDRYHLYFKAQDADRLYQGLEQAAATWSRAPEQTQEQVQTAAPAAEQRPGAEQTRLNRSGEVPETDRASLLEALGESKGAAARGPIKEQLASAAKEASARNAALAAAKAAVKVMETGKKAVLEESL